MSRTLRLFIIILGILFVPIVIIMILRLINGKELFISMHDIFNYVSSFEFFKYSSTAINDLQEMLGYFDTLAVEGADVFEYVKLIGNILYSAINGVLGLVRDLVDVIGFIFGLFSFVISY